MPTNRNKSMIIVLSTIFMAFFGACSKQEQQPPNIVYILVDQWRASATGYAGDPNVNTPNLDRLAGESLNFKNTVSVSPVCTPYRASFLTGRFPTSTGMFLNDAQLPEEELTIAEVLKEEGYQTAYIGKWHLDGHGRQTFIPKERRQGFDYWKASEVSHEYNESHYYEGDSKEMKFWEGYDVFSQTKEAKKYIESAIKKENPFALVISYGTPHFPHYSAPEAYKKNYPIDSIQLPGNVPESMQDYAKKEAQGYYAHCEALDHSIGDLLDEIDKLGIKKNTILVFTSDHGEMMGSHGIEPKVKQVPWAESARVPFLLRYPKVYGDKGQTIEMPVTTPDILPSLLNLAEIEVPATSEGKDFSDISKTSDDRAALYMGVAPFTRNPAYRKEYRAIKTKQFTYVKSLDGPWLLFDDKKDPLQMDNLINKAEHTTLQNKLDSQLNTLLEEIEDDFKPGASYIKKWGYKVDPERGHIPFKNFNQKPQIPRK